MFGFSCNVIKACALLACCARHSPSYCEICSEAYLYVMTTNWFQLFLNAAIQLPSGPSVSLCVFVCMCIWEIEWEREISQKCIWWVHLPPHLVLQTLESRWRVDVSCNSPGATARNISRKAFWRAELSCMLETVKVVKQLQTIFHQLHHQLIIIVPPSVWQRKTDLWTWMRTLWECAPWGMAVE